MFMLYEGGDELQLMPGEIRPKREVRMYSDEQIAQALIDGAVTPEGVEAARAGIRELGLDPDSFTPYL